MLVAVEAKTSQGQILFDRDASEYQESGEYADDGDSKCDNPRVAPEKKAEEILRKEHIWLTES